MDCAGCLTPIERRKHLKCSECEQHYDIQCANVKEALFNSLAKEHKAKWKCVLCISKQPKTDNTHTPVRSGMGGVNRNRGAATVSPQELLDESTEQSETIAGADIQSLISEVRQFKEEMRATRLQMEILNGTMASLTVRIDECDRKIGSLEARVDSLESRLAEGSALNSDGSLLETVEQLKSDLNDRDQELLCNDVEIASIPEEKNENLIHIVTTLSLKLGVNISDQDLVSATRVGRISESSDSVAVPRPRPIVVRLGRRALKDQVLAAARVRRGITTEDTGLPAPIRRFYINERLTKVNRLLFRRARELGSKLGWRFIWTRDGRIYARRHQSADSPRHRIRTESDLRRVFGADTVGATHSISKKN